MKQTAWELRALVVALLLLSTVIFSGASLEMAHADMNPQLENRCGWFSNPTPGNISLYDRDAEWIIGVQGGYQVEHDWPWPAFKRGQWVGTNAGSYGYGCACLRVQVDSQTERVIKIGSTSARALAACRKDPTLKRWKSLFQ